MNLAKTEIQTCNCCVFGFHSVIYNVLSKVTHFNYHLLFPLLFSSFLSHPSCQSYLRRVAFCFAKTSFGFGMHAILWVWHTYRTQRMHATCCTSLHRRTGFFFLPLAVLEKPFFPARTTKDVGFKLKLITISWMIPSVWNLLCVSVPLFMSVCIYFQAYNYSTYTVFTCTKKKAWIPKALWRSWESKAAHRT